MTDFIQRVSFKIKKLANPPVFLKYCRDVGPSCPFYYKLNSAYNCFISI